MRKILVVLLFFGQILLKAQGQGSLSGKIINSRSGQPMNNVIVSILGTDISTITDSTGYYNLSEIKTGEYFVVVNDIEKRITITAEQPSEFNIELNNIFQVRENRHIVFQPANSLEVKLKTDKSIYNLGDEIVFTISYKNNTNYEIAIIKDTHFIGGAFSFRTNDNIILECGSGTVHTIPPGRVTGEIKIVKPKSTIDINITAYISTNQMLSFEGPFFCSYFLNTDKEKKYNSCGLIFKYVANENIFVNYKYEARGWYRGAYGDDNLCPKIWVGSIISNEQKFLIEIE